MIEKKREFNNQIEIVKYIHKSGPNINLLTKSNCEKIVDILIINFNQG